MTCNRKCHCNSSLKVTDHSNASDDLNAPDPSGTIESTIAKLAQENRGDTYEATGSGD